MLCCIHKGADVRSRHDVKCIGEQAFPLSGRNAHRGCSELRLRSVPLGARLVARVPHLLHRLVQRRHAAVVHLLRTCMQGQMTSGSA